MLSVELINVVVKDCERAHRLPRKLASAVIKAGRSLAHIQVNYAWSGIATKGQNRPKTGHFKITFCDLFDGSEG